MKSQSGFTLIEMVAVIIILAIMAATAMPRFVNVSGEARLAALNGMTGAISASSSLAKSKWLLTASATLNSADMGGTFVSVINNNTVGSSTASIGFPTGTAVGIWRALDNPSGFSSGLNVNNGTVNFWPTGVTNSTVCFTSYQSGIVTMSPAAAIATCL